MVKEEALEKLGYFLKPSELFHKIAEIGNSKSDTGKENDETEDNSILEDLTNILRHIEQSKIGTDSEEEFGGGQNNSLELNFILEYISSVKPQDLKAHSDEVRKIMSYIIVNIF